MPALIDNHNKKVVETRLEKFYSSINQAIKMAELDYGAREDWYEDNLDIKAWCDKYIIPYMNVTKTGTVHFSGANMYTIYLADGNGFSIYDISSWYFFISNPEKCSYNSANGTTTAEGICVFSFYYDPNPASSSYTYNVEPYAVGWDGTLEKLKYDTFEGCYSTGYGNRYCTKLIQSNGWKIPKDYPHRVRRYN